MHLPANKHKHKSFISELEIVTALPTGEIMAHVGEPLLTLPLPGGCTSRLIALPFTVMLLTFAVLLDASAVVALHSFPVSWMSRSYVGREESCAC
jgi:hypothetical protein